MGNCRVRYVALIGENSGTRRKCARRDFVRMGSFPAPGVAARLIRLRYGPYDRTEDHGPRVRSVKCWILIASKTSVAGSPKPLTPCGEHSTRNSPGKGSPFGNGRCSPGQIRARNFRRPNSPNEWELKLPRWAEFSRGWNATVGWPAPAAPTIVEKSGFDRRPKPKRFGGGCCNAVTRCANGPPKACRARSWPHSSGLVK
jgi:hypothetical protein